MANFFDSIPGDDVAVAEPPASGNFFDSIPTDQPANFFDSIPTEDQPGTGNQEPVQPLPETAWNAIKRGTMDLAAVPVQAIGNVQRNVDEVLGFKAPFMVDMRRAGDVASELRMQSEAIRPIDPRNRFTAGIAGAVPTVAGLALTGGLAGTPAVLGLAGTMGAQSGFESADEIGVTSPAGRLAMAGGFGVAEAGIEALGGLGAKPVIGSAIKRFAKTARSELIEEPLTGAAQDMVTRVAATEDPNRPGFTATGYDLAQLNPTDPRYIDNRLLETAVGAAGGAMAGGLAALPAPPSSPIASVTPRASPVPTPAAQAEAPVIPATDADAGSTPAAGINPFEQPQDSIAGYVPPWWTEDAQSGQAQAGSIEGDLLNDFTILPTSPAAVASPNTPAAGASDEAGIESGSGDQTPIATAAQRGETLPVSGAVKRGEIGGMLGAGEVVMTASGRPTTPFPKLSMETNRGTQNTVKRVDAWLHANAVAEARARGDNFNLRQFEAENPAKMPPASKDAMEAYLFGETQPTVLKPLLKPISPVSSPPARADKAGQQPPEPQKGPPSSVAGQKTGGGGADSQPVDASRKWRRGLRIPARTDGAVDSVDYVMEHGRIQRPPKQQRNKMGDAKSGFGEHDMLRRFQKEMPIYYARLTAERGHEVDVMAGDAGYESADAFVGELMAHIQQRMDQSRAEQARQKATNKDEKGAIAQGKRQDVAFKKANQKAPADNAVPAGELNKGDTFTIDDTPLTVTEKWTDDNGTAWVAVEDGDRFGIQKIEADQIIRPDEAPMFDPFSDAGSQTLSEDAARAAGDTSADMFGYVPPPPPVVEPKAPVETTGDLGDILSGTESVRPMNAAETTVPQADDLLGGLGGAIRASETERAQRKIGFGSSAMAASNAPRQGTGTASGAPATPTPLPTHHNHGSTPAAATPGQQWSGQSHTLHGLRKYLLEQVGLPTVGVGRLSRALGTYYHKPEAVRLLSINDIPVLAHEIGHAIHARELSPGRGAGGVFADWGGQFDGELNALGAHTSKPSYTKDQVRAEGVAEFTRLWLTNPVRARAQAPKFSRFWEDALNIGNPKLAEGLVEARRRIADYIAMPAFEKARAQIVFDPLAEQPGRTVGQWMRGAYAKWVNTLQPALDVVREAGKRDPALATEAREVEAWMENHRGGWSSKAHSDIFSAQTNLDGKVIGDGLQQALSGLQPHEHEAFSTYLALKRAKEIEGSGRRSGFEHAALPRAEMQALEAKFEATRQKLLKWSDNSLQLLADSGLISGQAAADMRTANKDYVPFYRLYEKLNNISFGPEGSRNAGGFVDMQSGIRRLKGSDRAIIDPLQSVMKNAYMFRKIAEQNTIGRKFFDLMGQLQGHGEFAQSVRPKRTVKAQLTHDQIAQKLIEEGVIEDITDLPPNADLAFTLWEAMKKPDTASGEVIVFKNGERSHWEVKDPLLMEALKSADADAVSLWKLGPTMTKMLTAPTKVLRVGATGHPAFAIQNFFRDQFTAGVYSRSGFIPFWDGFKGAVDHFRKSGRLEKWMQAGGKFHGITTGTEAFKTMVDDVLPQDPIIRRKIKELSDVHNVKDALKVAQGLARDALDVLGRPGVFLEESTRLREFDRMIDQGASEREAANASKQVTLNFARAGERSRTLNMLTAFFNAKVQDIDLFARSHADPKTRYRTMTRAFAYITVPSILTWWLGKDDEEIQELPEWRKNLFWNLNLKPMAKALGRDNGFILSLPKPFLLGAVYGTAVERGLDAATKRDPNGAKKALGNLGDNLIGMSELVNGFSAFKPMIEANFNKSEFMGRPIVPERMQNLPKPQQYDTYTSETAKKLGQWTGQSPMMIDHLIRGYFATAGKWGTDAIDYAMAKSGMSDVPPPPTRDAFEHYLTNRFAGSPYASNAFVERFYKAANDMEGKLSVFNKQSAQMTTPEQAKFWKQHGEELDFYQRTVNFQTSLTGAGEIRKAQASLSEIGGAMKDVQAARDITPDDKRARLMELSKQRNLIAEDAFKTLFPDAVRKRHY